MIAGKALCVSQGPTNPTTMAYPADEALLAHVCSKDAVGHETDVNLGWLLRELRGRGVTVALKGDQISCIGLTSELRSRVRAHTPALIRLLAPKPLAVCEVRPHNSIFTPKTLTLVRHNRAGHNRLGQDATTHPFALINLAAWREADWNLAECRWYRDVADAGGVPQASV